MKKILLGTLILSGSLLTLSSCGEKKGGRNDLNETEVADKKESDGLVVTLEGIFPVNDSYQLFFSNDKNFTEDKSLRVTVYGQPVLQKLTFVLPAEAKPQNIRLDLGSNKVQTSISIKGFQLNYKDNELEFNDEKFRDYFPDSENVKFDVEKLVYNLNPNVDGVFDPIIFSNDNLKKELNKVYNTTTESK